MVKYDIKAVQRRIYVRVLKVKCVELSLHKLSHTAETWYIIETERRAMGEACVLREPQLLPT